MRQEVPHPQRAHRRSALESPIASGASTEGRPRETAHKHGRKSRMAACRSFTLFQQFSNDRLKLWKPSGRQIPHDRGIYVLIFVTKNIADADELLPFYLAMLCEH